MDTSEFIALCDGVQAEERTTNLHGSVYEEGCVRIKDALTPNGPDKTLIEMTKGEVHRTLSKLVKDIKSIINKKK